jgi:hypothetical protein
MQKLDWETMSAAKKITGEEHSLMSRPKTGRLANAWANEQRPRKINQREQTLERSEPQVSGVLTGRNSR